MTECGMFRSCVCSLTRILLETVEHVNLNREIAGPLVVRCLLLDDAD